MVRLTTWKYSKDLTKMGCKLELKHLFVTLISLRGICCGCQICLTVKKTHTHTHTHTHILTVNIAFNYLMSPSQSCFVKKWVQGMSQVNHILLYSKLLYGSVEWAVILCYYYTGLHVGKYQQERGETKGSNCFFSLHLSFILFSNASFFFSASLPTTSNMEVTAKTDLSKLERL